MSKPSLSFRRLPIMCYSENREFRAIVVIQSPLVKTPLTLQLQGTGSFDEAHRSN